MSRYFKIEHIERQGEVPKSKEPFSQTPTLDNPCGEMLYINQ